VVLVGGEPGIGKSRLTQVLRERIADAPHLTLRYQCSPYHLNSALYPIIEHLEFSAGFSLEDTPEQKLDKMEALLAGNHPSISEVAPLFAALLSLPVERYPPLSLSPQKRKEKTLETLADHVEALSRRRPVLMVFEDAHWIDPTSQEALDVLVRRVQGLSILLVITYRPEYLPRWGQLDHVAVMGVGRLGRYQGAELVANVTDGRVLPAAVLEQIVSHTDGVPLFVEELTKSVIESGLLRAVGNQYTLDHPLPAMAIPTSLRDSLLARLDRLAPVKDIVQVGACIGREFSHALLERIGVLSHDQLELGLRRLTEAGIVYRRGTPPNAIYAFKHALMQDAAYDSLLKSRRHQLHARIALVLERTSPIASQASRSSWPITTRNPGTSVLRSHCGRRPENWRPGEVRSGKRWRIWKRAWPCLGRCRRRQNATTSNSLSGNLSTRSGLGCVAGLRPKWRPTRR
jgi:predicted ATPase